VKHAAFLLALGGATLLASCASALAPVDPSVRQSYDAATIERGRALAVIGNCRGCHTTRAGAPFAGGEPMHSPFGTIYSSNITPDPQTGIGHWSEEAFLRAMRKGVRDDGQHLYPAFPYDRFTQVTDDDARAIYAYVMTQPPVRYTPPPNDLAFPFNIRAGIALWKALFLEEGPRPRPRRGEYLVEGLGHCGSCHSPRNALYAEKRAQANEGGDLEGWHAYAINGRNAAPIPWDARALAFYLRHGYHPDHGIARGTMGLVTQELAGAAPEDVDAMAEYVAALMGTPTNARRERALALKKADAADPAPPASEGAMIYETTCHGCHNGERAVPFGGLPLALSTGLTGESPRNLINVILHGINPADRETSPMMPGYAGALTDRQIETLVHWLRASRTDQPPWKDVDKLTAESRAMKPSMLLFPPGGTGAEP
jgi:mono/diheme cytochrome c family protein